MNLIKLKSKIPEKLYKKLEERKFETLLPCQVKAIEAGLFDNKNLVVCTPTGSGKTVVAELAAMNAIYHNIGKDMTRSRSRG